MESQAKIAIIGGSGLYDMDGIEVIDTVDFDTPFGRTSAPITIAKLGDRTIAFLPRHGLNHEFEPTDVPYRANIWALKMLGVEWIVTASAVGSLRREIKPGEFVIPDQIIDKTTKRPHFLYSGFVAHVNLAYPYEPLLRDVLIESVKSCGIKFHEVGTYVCMEGPAFSTKAESKMHQIWGADIVGMTAMPEARFAREAEIAYATIALPTDYDVWYEGEEVDVTQVLKVLKKNQENFKKVLADVIPKIPLERFGETISCNALRHTIMTKPDAINEHTRQEYAIVLDKYLK